MNPGRQVMHLVRRWRSSIDRSPLTRADLEFARACLIDAEWNLWSSMALADRRHSIVVARRFVSMAPHADDAEIAAALLHDVGKTVARLSTTERVLATLIALVVKPRRWSQYYRHEEIGLDLCRGLPSRDATLHLLGDVNHPLAEVLRRADDV